MSSINIAAVLSFCSRDARFFRACIEPLLSTFQQIVIPVCDHFYDGTKENSSLLAAFYRVYPSVEFIEFPYSETELFGTPAQLVPSSPDWAVHWHNTVRYIGFFFLDPSIDWVLFCDVDEIFEKEKWIDWLQSFPLQEYHCLRFATYWYFRSAKLRATEYPDGPLLVKRSALSPSLLLDQDERSGIFQKIVGKKKRQVMDKEGKAFVHHYSWVRTQEELLRKVSSWGHHWERDWPTFIQKEFASPFTGQDFVRGYTYEEVEPYFDPLEETILKVEKEEIPSVKRVTSQQLFRREIDFLVNRA